MRDHENDTPRGLPREVRNPVVGATVKFLVSSEETGGEYVKVRVTIPAGAQGPRPHYHLDFEETFTTVEGTLHMDHGDRRRIELTAGERVHVGTGIPHRYFNDGDEPAVFELVARPGLAFEQSIRASYGLAEDGRTDAEGVPRNLFEMALIFKLAQSYVKGVPLWLQKSLTRVGVALARRRGYDPEFGQYTRPQERAPHV